MTLNECSTFFLCHTKRWRAVKKIDFLRLPYLYQKEIKSDMDKLMEFLQTPVIYMDVTEDVEDLGFLHMEKEISISMKRVGDRFRFEANEAIDKEKALEIQAQFKKRVEGYGFDSFDGRSWTCAVSCE